MGRFIGNCPFYQIITYFPPQKDAPYQCGKRAGAPRLCEQAEKIHPNLSNVFSRQCA
jgi:hypothetical protein